MELYFESRKALLCDMGCSACLGGVYHRLQRESYGRKFLKAKVMGVDPSVEVCVVGAKQAGPEEFVTWALSSE